MDNSKEKIKKQLDTDIVQCRKDVLRARDIIPSKDPEHPKKESATEPKRPPIPIKSLPEFNTILSEPKAPDKDTVAEIPMFNLAEQMASTQREISSTKRQGPGRKSDQVQKIVAEARNMLSSQTDNIDPASPQHKIIAEIVTRDIKKFSERKINQQNNIG